ncbi:protection of telomeres protein 1a [Cryptomeria japonica]|uniref:protection of telomeres protein 1a n=1 Tax=Cryptomeria japonica TaxID=3369 RepID=UPI0027DA9EC0|nr:protection of telomeres protein 1a [Cryptomeria japonica]
MDDKQYEYMPIVSAMISVNTKVNIYGVIAEYEQPKPTKGSDMMSTMTIVDMSYPSPGLRLIAFDADSKKLPHVNKIGDIIRLRHVQIEHHNNAVNAVAKKKYSSFLLFEGNSGSSYEPYQFSHDGYKFTDHDKMLISSLRKWLESSPLYIGKSDYAAQIKDIKERAYFDLCCKVLLLHEKSEKLSVIYVWDGTDAPPQEFEMKQEEETDIVADPFGESSLIALQRNDLCNFPSVGSVIPVYVEMPINELQSRFPKIGRWVKLRNMTCRRNSGLWEGVMTDKSKVSSISPEMEKMYVRDSAERLETNSYLPQWCPKILDGITVTNCEGIRFSSLIDVITNSQVTYKFRCLVRVIASLPRNVEEFCGERKNSENNIEYFYRVRLTLEDATARIHAYLYGEDANKFFSGYPPTSLMGSTINLVALKTKFYKLLGINECNSNEGEKSSRIQNPPWVECCIKSYYLDKSSPWDSRRYRIFGTTLQG